MEIVAGPQTDQAGRVTALVGTVFDGNTQNLTACLTRDDIGACLSALAKLDGDYALAHWDPIQRRLILATSPMASRTLYWHRDGQRIWFASSLAQLFRFPDVPRRVSALNAASHVSALVLDPADTIYDGIRLLPQGTALVFDPRGLRIEPLWRPDPTRRITRARPDDYVDEARHLLENAVRVRLSARTAATLSGGLDSPAVAVTAAGLLRPDLLHTFTAMPPPGRAAFPARGFYGSEAPAVNAIVAMQGNMRAHFCHGSAPADFECDPTPLFVQSGRPVITVGMLGWMAPTYAEARAQGHDTLLLATAGNFTLSYDGRNAFADLMRAGRPIHALAQLIRVSRFRNRSLSAEIRQMVQGLFPKARQNWKAYRGTSHEWIATSPVRPEFMTEIGLVERMVELGEHGLGPAANDSRSVQAHFIHARRSRIVEANLSISLHFGLNLPDPLSDRRLAEFCLAIPRQHFFGRGKDRALARRVMAGRVPDWVLNQSLYGQPNVEWFDRLTPQRAEISAEIDRLTRVPMAAAMLDLPRLKALVDNWPQDAASANEHRYEYESLLTRGVHMGRFLRWVDGGND
jgi:asparagine synthase (glutamine-hydrolysing)